MSDLTEAAEAVVNAWPTKLYAVRVASGRSLRDCARELGMTPHRLGDLEWGRDEPTDEEQAAITRLLGES
jgi:hypothetical protein